MEALDSRRCLKADAYQFLVPERTVCSGLWQLRSILKVAGAGKGLGLGMSILVNVGWEPSIHHIVGLGPRQAAISTGALEC